MKKKRKSPKALRQFKKYGVLRSVDGFHFVAAGTLTFGDTIIEDGDTEYFMQTGQPSVSFSYDYDTGMAFRAGDCISITAGQSDDRSNRVDHRKVHVARRRKSKGKPKPTFYEIESATATTITVKDTSNGLYTVTSA